MADFADAFKVDLTGFEPAFHYREPHRAFRFSWPVPVPLLFGVRMPYPGQYLGHGRTDGTLAPALPMLQPVPVRDWVNWPLVLVALRSWLLLHLGCPQFLTIARSGPAHAPWCHCQSHH